MLHIAHRELERLVLDRDTLHFKQSVSVRYAQLIYDGLWFSTLREALAAFVDETEQEVTGEVRLRLYKGTRRGRRPPLAAQPLPPGPRHVRRRAWPTTTRTPRASSGSSACPSACARSPATASRSTSRRSRRASRSGGRREEVTALERRHGTARLPRGGRRGGHQAGPARPRAARRRRRRAPRPASSPPTARRPRRCSSRASTSPRAARARSSSTRAAPTPAPARPASRTRARWPRSRRGPSAAAPSEVVVASTGVIGVRLPMDEAARRHRRARSPRSRARAAPRPRARS